ncbi:putative ABC transport system substrate-binding protein [Bradyrhizobium erythrophlei]|nr:putative ABC transport system substrate-binding protein [Bradyrhizobium erythrophlei]
MLRGFNRQKNRRHEICDAVVLDRLPEMAAELVKRPIAALVAVGGSNSAMAAKRASSTIPIVFVIGGDPVRLGLAASLSRPAGNATGMTIISADLAPKRLGLLRELVPNATALAALTNPNTPEGRGQSSDMLTAALALGLKLRLLEASDERGIEAAFAALSQDKPDALLVGSDPIFDVHRDKLVALVAAAAIPAIYQFRDFAAAGGLMSYDPDIVDAHRQIGIYVGKILKGALPADLPIQQPTKFQLVINLRTAKTLGLTVSPTLLVPVVNQIRTYWWCSPPRTGRQRMVPASLTARETGASFSKDKCVLISL